MLGLQRNGGNRILFSVINSLAESGCVLEVITPAHAGEPGFEIDKSVKITPLELARGPKLLAWLLFVPLCAWRLKGHQILANHFVTAVSAQLAAAISKRTSIFYFVQDIEYEFYRFPFSIIARWLCFFTYRIHGLMPSNRYLESKLNLMGFPSLKSCGIGIEDDFLDLKLASADKRFDVLLFLRRGKHKRLDLSYSLIRALHKKGIITVAIAPSIELIKPVEKSIGWGFVAASDLELVEILDSTKLLALTSGHEGFALPPLEAMARGLPVVLFSCGGPLQYAKHQENSMISNVGDLKGMITNIETILQNKRTYERLSNKAKETASKYRLSESARRTADAVMEYFTSKNSTT